MEDNRLSEQLTIRQLLLVIFILFPVSWFLAVVQLFKAIISWMMSDE